MERSGDRRSSIPGVGLPAGKISIVHRSDGSGTTFNFSNYLSKVSPEWKTKVGEGTSVQWPAGVGGKGNEGVASYVKQIKGSIGYVELAYALQNKMPYASLQNAAGKWVQPNAESFAAAAASADWASAKDFNLVITNASGAKAWPITATNFMLMHKQPKDAKRSADTLAFFKWAFENGQAAGEVAGLRAAAAGPGAADRSVLGERVQADVPARALARGLPDRTGMPVIPRRRDPATLQRCSRRIRSHWVPAFAGMTSARHDQPS